MFNIGFSELVILAVLGLLVLGPDQLPNMARKLARMINDLKRASEEVFSPIEDVKRQARDLAEKAREQVRLTAEEALKEDQAPQPTKVLDDKEDGSSERG